MIPLNSLKDLFALLQTRRDRVNFSDIPILLKTEKEVIKITGAENLPNGGLLLNLEQNIITNQQIDKLVDKISDISKSLEEIAECFKQLFEIDKSPEYPSYEDEK